ncbi:MAG: hypothetical protein AB7U95_40075 [Reyranella sp.]
MARHVTRRDGPEFKEEKSREARPDSNARRRHRLRGREPGPQQRHAIRAALDPSGNQQLWRLARQQRHAIRAARVVAVSNIPYGPYPGPATGRPAPARAASALRSAQVVRITRKARDASMRRCLSFS